MDQNGSPRTDVFFMVISALLFGYFGFTTNFIHHGAGGQLLIYVPMLEWTLKISAIAFGAAALITFIRPFVGSAIYSLTGLLSAIMFVIIAIMDFADTQHTAMSPLLLLLFAAWNGFNSWAGLRELMAALRRRRGPP